MLNSSSNFPSHTHTHWLSHFNSGCVVSTSCQSSRECFNNKSGFITSLAVSLQPCAHTSLSSVHSDARASRLLPPRLSASATCLKSPTPHIFWQRSAMLRTIWRARFFPLCGRVSRGLSSVLSKRERITAEISGSGEGEQKHAADRQAPIKNR